MDLEILIRFVLAALWGGLVGAEREYRSKSAGLRTMMMISIGSCFFTVMSQILGAPDNEDRLAANIVTGIGFLGAGVIFHAENRVNGITTAATIWTVAAVGMGIGSGAYFAAGLGSILIFVVLAILSYIERAIDLWNQSKFYVIHCRQDSNGKSDIEKLFLQYHLKYRLLNQARNGENLTFRWTARGKATNHELFTNEALLYSSFDSFES